MEVSKYLKPEAAAPDMVSWEQLIRLSGQSVPLIDELRTEEAIGEHAKSWLSFCVRAFPESVVFQTLSKASYPEILDIWSDQVVKSELAESQNGVEEVLRPYQMNSFFRRSYHQLLCTRSSVLTKLNQIEREFKKSDSILVVGDDDQLSPLLVRAGYQNVTVIDVDESLIAALTHHCGPSLRTRVHDLNKEPPMDLIGDYQLIVMDPPYSLDGIKMFLEGALKFCKSESKPRIQVYCATVCLARQGLAEFQKFMKGKKFIFESLRVGVCHYPYSPVVHFGFVALYAAAAIRVGEAKRYFRSRLIPKSVSSDLWSFRSETEREKKSSFSR